MRACVCVHMPANARARSKNYFQRDQNTTKKPRDPEHKQPCPNLEVKVEDNLLLKERRTSDSLKFCFSAPKATHSFTHLINEPINWFFINQS